MKKLNLENYNIDVVATNGEKKQIPYDVKETVISILMHPKLGLNGRDLLLASELALKIEKCDESFILLEDEEHKKLVNAVNTIKGFNRNEVEFVKRILNAETVDVTEQKAK